MGCVDCGKTEKQNEEFPPGLFLEEDVDIGKMTIVRASSDTTKSPTVTECQCAKNGRPELEGDGNTFFCTTHNCYKTPHFYDLCRTKSGYWKQWEKDQGPGQFKIANNKNKRPSRKRKKPKGGAGTELKLLLQKFWIANKEDCGCDKMANEMNQKGTVWCRDNAEDILNHMKKQAKKRKLPFVKIAASKLLQIAIKRAEKKEKQKLGE